METKLKAVSELAQAITHFVSVFGKWESIILAALVIVCFLAWRYMEGQRADRGWREALKGKEQMVQLINEQNRELRVQSFHISGQFSKEEASRLVYSKDVFEAHDRGGE